MIWQWLLHIIIQRKVDIMGRVLEHLERGRFLNDDDFLPMTDEALDEYAYEYEQQQEKIHGDHKNNGIKLGHKRLAYDHLYS